MDNCLAVVIDDPVRVGHLALSGHGKRFALIRIASWRSRFRAHEAADCATSISAGVNPGRSEISCTAEKVEHVDERRDSGSIELEGIHSEVPISEQV